MYSRELIVLVFAVAISLSSADSFNNDKNSISQRSLFSCVNDNDCSNQGKCDASGTCSCYSGYGSVGTVHDCAVAPSSTCASNYTNISTLSASLSPSWTVDVKNSTFTLDISLPLEETQFSDSGDSTSSLRNSSSSAYSLETTITFGSTSSCNYPPSPSSTFWTKVAAGAGSCEDRYVFTTQWTDAKSQCGFTYSAAVKAWVQEVTITRYYSIPFDPNSVEGQKRSSIIRTQSSVQQVRIVFPESVTSTAGVNVTGPIAVSSSAFASVAYTPSVDAWKVDVMVATANPYKLVHPLITVSGIDSSRLLGAQTLIDDVSSCNSNMESCTQKVSVFISGCSALNGQVSISLAAACSGVSDQKTCSEVSGRVTLTASLDTEGSCDIVKNITIDTKSLTAYSSEDMIVTSNSFNATDLAYFGAIISSSDALIDNKTVVSVCFFLDPRTNSVCTPFNFTTFVSGNAMIDPAFYVDLAQTRSLTNDTLEHTFGVKVTFSIGFSSPSTMRRSDDSSVQSVESIVHIKVTQSNATSNATTSSESEIASSIESTTKETDSMEHKFKVAVIAGSIAGAIIIFGVVIVLILVLRKRNQAREAERSFNFSQIN